MTNWQESKELSAFLAKVESFTALYNTVSVGATEISLCHCFWSVAEIIDGESIKGEWDVPQAYVPFYGDWHDLFCIDTSSEPCKVLQLNDSRDLVFSWNDIKTFESSLKTIPDELGDDIGVVEEESWLDI